MNIGKVLVVAVQFIFILGCGMDSKKENPNPNDPEKNNNSISELSIKPEDWLIESSQKNGAQISTRRLKEEKLEFVKKNFHAPTLSPVTVPESNGFELYRIRGYKELEGAVYIQPKVYINT